MAKTFLRIGCYIAFLAAALHMVAAHILPPPPPTSDTEKQLMDLATNFKSAMPGGQMRSMMDIVNGFSLLMALNLALTGGLGLIVARRAVNDPLLMKATAGALAGGYLVAVAISLTHFFIVPIALFGASALCFTIAAFTTRTS